jgi:hypothetical protein
VWLRLLILKSVFDCGAAVPPVLMVRRRNRPVWRNGRSVSHRQIRGSRRPGNARLKAPGGDAHGGVRALHLAAFDELGAAPCAGSAARRLPWPVVRRVCSRCRDRQPQQLDHRLVVGEMATVFDDLAQLIVQPLNRIRGLDDLANVRREQKRDGWQQGASAGDRCACQPVGVGWLIRED